MPSQMPPAEQQQLARAVRRLRMERGMNLRQAAGLLDLDFTMLSRLENGKRGFRQVRRPALTAERIAEAFGVTVEEVRRPCPRCGYAPRAGYICGRCGTEGEQPGDELVVVDGRPYRLRVDKPNCGGIHHYHDEPHADDTPGNESHHHHSERCAEFPRQATLIPAWEIEPRHAHDFGADSRCACGAWREELPDTKRRRPGDPRPLKRRVGYHNPPDGNHPDGWSYERKEEPEGQS